jgi:tRNA(Arg) A34 adenosine deaminase TadA
MWATVDPPWQECFQLAWRSFQAGSIPVGAVLIDDRGSIVATGRNRIYETATPVGQIGGSSVAHAELNALATLPPGDYTEHVLFTTLEPCLLCAAALRYSHVGTVRFAARDPMWHGLDEVPQLNRHFARHWPRMIGPLESPLQTWSVVLHLVSALERNVRSAVECHADAMPYALSVARSLAAPEMIRRIRAMPLLSALCEVWRDIQCGEP